jgi:hypothetical protein
MNCHRLLFPQARDCNGDLAFVIPIDSEAAQNTCPDKSSDVGVCQNAQNGARDGGHRSGKVEWSKIETCNAQRIQFYDAAQAATGGKFTKTIWVQTTLCAQKASKTRAVSSRPKAETRYSIVSGA